MLVLKVVMVRIHAVVVIVGRLLLIVVSNHLNNVSQHTTVVALWCFFVQITKKKTE